MHDNEFKTNKGNKIKIKDKIEPQLLKLINNSLRKYKGN